jgi:MFS family permease
LYAYAFLGDLVLLYPVYALLFAETGLSTAQISSLLAIWSITSFTLEIPSGVWADATSRRLLLALGPVLSGAGFALWIVAPSYPAFALGFALWGAQGALRSGALEALVYEELDRLGAASRYAHVIGRATAVETVAATLAIGLAAPVFAIGGFAAVGAASAIACVAAAAAGATFPEHRARPGRDGAAGFRAYVAVLRAGVADVRATPALRVALLLVPAVSAIWGALDEYVPLLASDTGVRAENVPLLFGLVYVGVTAGGLLGGPAGRLSSRALAGLLAAAATALAVGAMSGLPSGFVLIAAAFCAFQAVTVVVNARLQHAIAGSSRSTVTSLAGFATELLVVGVFAGYGVGSAVAGNATLFAGFAAGYVIVAAAMLIAPQSSKNA